MVQAWQSSIRAVWAHHSPWAYFIGKWDTVFDELGPRTQLESVNHAVNVGCKQSSVPVKPMSKRVRTKGLKGFSRLSLSGVSSLNIDIYFDVDAKCKQEKST